MIELRLLLLQRKWWIVDYLLHIVHSFDEPPHVETNQFLNDVQALYGCLLSVVLRYWGGDFRRYDISVAVVAAVVVAVAAVVGAAQTVAVAAVAAAAAAAAAVGDGDGDGDDDVGMVVGAGWPVVDKERTTIDVFASIPHHSLVVRTDHHRTIRSACSETFQQAPRAL